MLTVAAARPHGQILDENYLESLLAAWDARYGHEDCDWTPPVAPKVPESPLWRRAKAEAARWAALLTLTSPIHPPIIGNIIDGQIFHLRPPCSIPERRVERHVGRRGHVVISVACVPSKVTPVRAIKSLYMLARGVYNNHRPNVLE